MDVPSSAPATYSEQPPSTPAGFGSADLSLTVDPNPVALGDQILIAGSCLLTSEIAGTLTIRRADDGFVGMEPTVPTEIREGGDGLVVQYGLSVPIEASLVPGDWLIELACPHGPSPEPVALQIVDATV